MFNNKPHKHTRWNIISYQFFGILLAILSVCTLITLVAPPDMLGDVAKIFGAMIMVGFGIASVVCISIADEIEKSDYPRGLVVPVTTSDPIKR